MIYIIDGSNFSTLEGFWKEVEIVFTDFISEVGAFGKNFSAFRDILCVAPKETIVVWKNSKMSQQKLGYFETKRQLELSLLSCHPSWTEIVKKEIQLAEINQGETIFYKLIRVLVEEENVQLRLE